MSTLNMRRSRLKTRYKTNTESIYSYLAANLPWGDMIRYVTCGSYLRYTGGKRESHLHPESLVIQVNVLGNCTLEVHVHSDGTIEIKNRLTGTNLIHNKALPNRALDFMSGAVLNCYGNESGTFVPGQMWNDFEDIQDTVERWRKENNDHV